MTTRRKHLMQFGAWFNVHGRDVQTLLDGAARSRNGTYHVIPDDEDINLDDMVLCWIDYGPVRGANLTDVIRFFDRIKVSYSVEPETNEPVYRCGCGTAGGSCTWDS